MMQNRQVKTENKKFSNIQLRLVLLLLQILLPFGLYVALTKDLSMAAWVIAGVFSLSVGVLIWRG